MNGAESRQSADYFREKAIIALSTLSGDDVDKAIQKATSHMLKAPKEKYVQQIIAFSYGRSGVAVHRGLPINAYLVRELEKRLRASSWVIVLKTLVVLHRLLMDASEAMVEQLCSHPRLFVADAIGVVCDSADAMTQLHFIAQYRGVLAERCALQSFLHSDLRLDSPQLLNCLMTRDNAAALPYCTALLRLLQTIGNVQYIDLSVNNFCTLEAYQLIVRDGKQVFQLLSQRLVRALEDFEQEQLAQKRAWLELYREYACATDALRLLFDSMRSSPRTFVEYIPQLHPLPTSTLSRLETSVRLATMPQEVCTLASLGIAPTCEASRVTRQTRTQTSTSASTATVDAAEVSAVARASPLRRDKDDAGDGADSRKMPSRHTAQRTSYTQASSPPPAQPAVTLDELFGAAPVAHTTTTMQPATTPLQTVDAIFAPGASPSANMSEGWSTGAPVEYAGGAAPATTPLRGFLPSHMCPQPPRVTPP